MLPAALIVAGAGIQAYAQYQAGQSAAEAGYQNAEMKRAHAREMLSRLKIQEERISAQGDAFKAEQINQYASSGVQLGTGATLVAMEDTNMKISQQAEDLRRDVTFKANQLMLGADYMEDQADDAARAGKWGALGSLVGGGASIYKNT